MAILRNKTLPFVLFRLKSNLYGLPSRRVSGIVNVPQVVSIPEAPREIRGVVNLRGKIVKLLDLRVRLGFASAHSELDELIQMLHARELDHRNWLLELETCVRERKPFTLARDPHKCRFGQWYDSYRPDNTLLKMVLQKMDQPHCRIHAAAGEVLTRAESGDLDGGLRLLEERRRGELATLIKLFEEARNLLQEQHRDLALVLSDGTSQCAVCIDSVESVERIPEENIEPMPAALACLNDGLQASVGKRNKTNETILLLNDELLLTSGQ